MCFRVKVCLSKYCNVLSIKCYICSKSMQVCTDMRWPSVFQSKSVFGKIVQSVKCYICAVKVCASVHRYEVAKCVSE